jgi:hypothetical protein
MESGSIYNLIELVLFQTRRRRDLSNLFAGDGRWGELGGLCYKLP